jgi:hypothetical protein
MNFIFHRSSRRDFLIYSKSDQVIYPLDFERFQIRLRPQKRPEQSRIDTYQYHCTVWADGLDNPVKEQLTIRFSS